MGIGYVALKKYEGSAGLINMTNFPANIPNLATNVDFGLFSLTD